MHTAAKKKTNIIAWLMLLLLPVGIFIYMRAKKKKQQNNMLAGDPENREIPKKPVGSVYVGNTIRDGNGNAAPPSWSTTATPQQIAIANEPIKESMPLPVRVLQAIQTGGVKEPQAPTTWVPPANANLIRTASAVNPNNFNTKEFI